MSSAERLTEYKAVFRWTLSLGLVVVAVADDVGLEMETEETEESRGVSVTPATPTRVKAAKGAGVGAGVGTFEGVGGIDCETEAKPEREGVEGVEGEGGATGFDDADVPTLAKAEVEVQVVVDVVVVVVVVVVVTDADELSAKVVAGVNAGSGVVTFAGDAPALRVEGWGSGWCWCGGFEVRLRPRGVESFCLFSLSLLPTDLAR